MSRLMRQELAALEAGVAMCERCWGPERRTGARLARPVRRPGLLVLLERPPRGLLGRGERLELGAADASLRFLRELLHEAAIPEAEVMLGSCLLCRPHARRLEAAVPLAVSVGECTTHVRELLRVTAPRLVVSLGRVALRALRAALPAEPEVDALRFPESVGRAARTAGGACVVPVYHVTPRARLSRPEERQRADWRGVGEVWRAVAAR